MPSSVHRVFVCNIVTGQHFAVAICSGKAGLRIDKSQKVVVLGDTSLNRGVSHGALRGSVLGLMLFKVFIHDLEMTIKSLLIKFVVDSKIVRVVNNAGQSSLQNGGR